MPSILFIYPNIESELRIPLGISILISYAKNMRCDVELFDTTFMVPNNRKDDHLQEEAGILKKTNIDDLIGDIPEIDLDLAWENKVKEFKPDIIACSLLERNFIHADRFLRVAKKYHPKCKIIVGGILPTIAADFVRKNMPYVDSMCIGEGENWLSLYLDKMIEPKEYSGVPDLDSVLWQNWDLFDDRHLLKAFDGNVYRAGSFEYSRSCSYAKCRFCVAPKLKEIYGKKRKSAVGFAKELKYFKERYDLNMMSFTDVGYVERMTDLDKDEFLKKYSSDINLPYICQSGFRVLSREENVEFLKKTNCVNVSVGLEAGSIRVRHGVMNKIISDETIFKAVDNLHKHSVRFTTNAIIGSPTETEEEILKTIEFIKKINSPAAALHIFQPFLGTDLYDFCVEKGYYKFDPYADVYEGSALDQPQISRERINELYQYAAKEIFGNKSK